MMLFISFLGERISMVSGPSSGISIVVTTSRTIQYSLLNYGHAYNGHHSNYIWHVSHR